MGSADCVHILQKAPSDILLGRFGAFLCGLEKKLHMTGQGIFHVF